MIYSVQIFLPLR